MSTRTEKRNWQKVVLSTIGASPAVMAGGAGLVRINWGTAGTRRRKTMRFQRRSRKGILQWKLRNAL